MITYYIVSIHETIPCILTLQDLTEHTAHQKPLTIAAAATKTH